MTQDKFQNVKRKNVSSLRNIFCKAVKLRRLVESKTETERERNAGIKYLGKESA